MDPYRRLAAEMIPAGHRPVGLAGAVGGRLVTCRTAPPILADGVQITDMGRSAKDTEMTSKTSRTARNAYRAHQVAALALLARIRDALEDGAAPAPEELNWGHVGDMAETERELQQLADRLFGEGEFAPENA